MHTHLAQKLLEKYIKLMKVIPLDIWDNNYHTFQLSLLLIFFPREFKVLDLFPQPQAPQCDMTSSSFSA